VKVIPLKQNPRTYSCISYLVLGSWNRLDDVNTLVDVGIDDYSIGEISGINTGVGKQPVERIILTHNHFDHAAGAPAVKARFKAEVLAWAPGLGIDRLLHDGEELRLGDQYFEVIHVPGHSQDSICLYNHENGVLFSGDTAIRIQSPEGSYMPEYVKVIERLTRLRILTIFSGHDPPVTEGCDALLHNTLQMIRRGTILPSNADPKGDSLIRSIDPFVVLAHG